MEQIQEHEKNVKKFNEELNEHNPIGLPEDANAREAQNFEDQKKYFKFEVCLNKLILSDLMPNCHGNDTGFIIHNCY